MTKIDKSKSEIITFKVDSSLMEAMKAIPNRSEFIRSAVFAALDNMCPLCSGTGILTPNQKRHLNDLSSDHSIEECAHCHELRLICTRGKNSQLLDRK